MRGYSGSIAIDDAAVDRDASAVHTSVRELVGLIESSGPEPLAGDKQHPTEVVLLDMEVDGARYLLVRMPKHDHERLQLSPREYEIVRMVAKGHPNKVIADVLNISAWTVCTHLRRIFAKMGVGSRAAMVAQLMERGAVPHEHKMPAMPRSQL